MIMLDMEVKRGRLASPVEARHIQNLESRQSAPALCLGLQPPNTLALAPVDSHFEITTRAHFSISLSPGVLYIDYGDGIEERLLLLWSSSMSHPESPCASCRLHTYDVPIFMRHV